MFARSVVALSLFALLANAVPCVRQYTIQAGDICDSISAANNVSTYQLATINPSINPSCSNLTPGSTICLGYQGEDCTTTYVVKSGDTCDEVSSVAGINSTILWANNPQIDSQCSNIYIGEVLCVAKSVIVPPSSGLVNSDIPATATPAHTPAPTGSNDDDDLPWCDEL